MTSAHNMIEFLGTNQCVDCLTRLPEYIAVAQGVPREGTFA